MSREHIKYCFECDCTGEIPIDQPPKNLPREALIHYSKTTGLPVAECLANLVKDALLSDTDDPLHVNGLEFIRLLDSVLLAKN